MKICVLLPSYEECVPPCPEYNDNWDPEYYFPKGQQDHSFERVLIGKATAYKQLKNLSKKGYDVFINLCDSGFDAENAGIEVTQFLDALNLPSTGPPAAYFDPSKEFQKMMTHFRGVPTPEFIFAFNDADIEEAHQSLKYPLMVKNYNGHASIGMSKKSVVTNRDELFEMAKIMINEHEGALIEEFVEGREYTVLVLENPEEITKPLSFAPVECIFLKGETFKHFDVKFVDLTNMKWVPCIDEALSTQLQDLTKKMFISLGGTSYSRADYRVNENGEIYFLEMNAVPAVFYIPPKDDPDGVASADLILRHDGFGHVKFVEHLIDCAIKRAKKRVKMCEVRYKPRIGYGLYAKSDIKEGEVVIRNEDNSHVTPTNLNRGLYDILKKISLEGFGHRMANNGWTIWSDSHSDWLRINESDDPNSRIENLHLIAKRFIAKGEQITMNAI